MIKVTGNVHRSYIFPTHRAAAFAYYSDFNRVVNLLSLISLIHSYGEEQYRVRYDSVELGFYRIQIDCDVQTVFDKENWALYVQAVNSKETSSPEVSFYSSKTHGVYSSESSFFAEGDQTRVEYTLQLHATLKPPLGLRFVPGRILDQIAYNITQWRIKDIAESFIQESILDFQNSELAR